MKEQDLKCVFNGPQMSDDFACAMGRQVVRRGGPDIACSSDSAQRPCAQLYESLKAAALAHMDLEDDLLSMPHSVLLKIQYGGLLGLQRQLGDAAETVSDIHDLVTRVLNQYGDADAVPVDTVAPEIAAYKIARRRGRKR